jgi:DNA-binding GntR family transcriptional regulator
MKIGTEIGASTLNRLMDASPVIARDVLERMTCEGYLATSLYQRPRIVSPSPDQARAAFETLGLVVTHVIRQFSAADKTLSPDERELIETHLKVQDAADEAGERIDAHLLAIEFPILLAAIHGVAALTEMVAAQCVMLTLSLKTWSQFPPPACHAAPQRALATAILEHRTDDARAAFSQGHARLLDTLRFDTPENYEADDLESLLEQGRYPEAGAGK